MSSSNNKAEEKITTTAPLENAPKVDDASKVKNAVAATTDEAVKKVPRKIIRRRRRQPQQEAAPPAVDPVLLDKVLRESSLPNAYSFEILKTVERIRDTKATHVALQMPEGLLMYATVIADLLLRLAATWCTQVSILGDVTYGACCIDDLGAQALGAELLVHYGHSCLVPLQHTALPCLYVFVEIQMDIPHLVDCVVATLLDGATSPTTKDGTPVVYLLGTVQFRHALAQARRLLQDRGLPHVYIPQAK
jgi:2-(3-amino-3-carboxypropyl)histidine synthase